MYDHKLPMGIIRLYFQYTTKQIYLTLLALLGSGYRLKDYLALSKGMPMCLIYLNIGKFNCCFNSTNVPSCQWLFMTFSFYLQV